MSIWRMPNELTIKLTKEAYDLAEKNGRSSRGGCIFSRAINLSYPELQNVHTSTTEVSFLDPNTRQRYHFPTPPRVVELLFSFDPDVDEGGYTWAQIESAYSDLVSPGAVLKVKTAHIDAPRRAATAKQRTERHEKAALRRAEYANETPKQKRDRIERNKQREMRMRGTGVA